MQPPTNDWPDTEKARHGLFIAQSMRELLNRRTYESFRVQTLDLNARFREVNHLLQQHSIGLIRRAALIAPIAELEESIRIDPIAHKIAGSEINQFRRILSKYEKSGEFDSTRLMHLTRYISIRFSDSYKQNIENEILDCLDDLNSKRHAQRALQAYLSYLLNQDYSRSYIGAVVELTFFQKPIRRVDRALFRKFMNNFDLSVKQFEVVIPVQRGTIGFLGALGVERFSAKKREELSVHFQKAIKLSARLSPKDKFFQITNKGKDPYKAADTSRQVLNIIVSTTVLENQGVRLLDRDESFVAEVGKRKAIKVTSEDSRLQTLRTFTTKSQGERILSNTSSVINDFSGESQERLLNSLDSASLARNSRNLENQLTLIWSATEVLFGDPPDGKSRIEYYVDSLIPCLCLNYAWRNCAAVHRDLLTHHRHSLEAALDQAEIDDKIDSLKRFQTFVFGHDFQDDHHLLLDKISANPLALNRMHRLHSKFNSPSVYLRSIKDHEKRATWQIHRIYRLRNEFIHAGKKYNFAYSLSLNAFEYYKTALHAILFRAKNESYIHDLDFHHSSISLSYQARLEELTSVKNQKASSDEFMKFFDRI